MVNIKKSDSRIIYSSVYNIRPILNEISIYHHNVYFNKHEENCILDDYYGTTFSISAYKKICPYGISKEMADYDCMGPEQDRFKSIGYLRVPYRRIPIFNVTENSQAKEIIDSIKKYYPNHHILFRGQGCCYTINRTDEDRFLLFNDVSAKEPSFLSSHCRPNINLKETFLRNLWNWQGRMLLHDMDIELKKHLPKDKFRQFEKSKKEIEGTNKLSLFSLGIAQHYGLPSVGLDLTDDYETALCFASNDFISSDNNNLVVKPLENFDDSMIYVFRCPQNIVFSYSDTKPSFFPTSRPDVQHAWFGYTGWGYAKNQMAMHLACCIKVSKEMYKSISPNYIKSLFPSSYDDPILAHFLKIKQKSTYEPSVANVLNRLYNVIFQ